MSNASPHQCRCSCGELEVTVTGEPIVRIYCHCSFCQDFNQAAYADVCGFADKQVRLTQGKLDFKRYSPLVKRGVCSTCGDPMLEYTIGPGPLKVAAVPTARFPKSAKLPEAACHGFYHRRQQDHDDALPKYHGALRSELGFGQQVLKGLAKRALGSVRR